VSGLPAPVAVNPPEEDVTVYDVIAAPLAGGALNVTVAWWLPGLAATSVGAPGTVRGVTAFEGAEGELGPTLFVAITVNV
jgi:hypothetical protein